MVVMQAVSVGGELLEVVPVKQTYIAILHEKSKSKGGRANLEYLDDLIKCLTGEEISLYQTHYPALSSTKITSSLLTRFYFLINSGELLITLRED